MSVMQCSKLSGDPWIVRAGRWLTKRRGILLAPLFAVVLLAARPAASVWLEALQDCVGLVCLIGGARLRLVAASYHESSHCSEPITAGPYAWIRHPLYVANFLLGFGIVLLAGWWPLIVGYCLFFIPLHTVIARAEEVHLSTLYGAKYELCRRTIPAIFPWRPYPGPRYGIHSKFKIRKGREWLKLLGYLAGVLGVLLVKWTRSLVRLPMLRPLPTLVYCLGSAIVAVLVILRPKTRSSWLRGAQTTIATVCVLLLAIHLHSVWPPAPPPFTSVGSSVSTLPTAVSPRQASCRVAQRAPEQGAHPEEKPMRSASSPPRPRGFFSGVGRFLWDHLDAVGGASAFGIAALIEEEREEERGRKFTVDNDLNEAGQVAVLAAAAIGLWKQWHGKTASASFSSSGNDHWQMRVRPVLDEDGVAVLTICKRRL